MTLKDLVLQVYYQNSIVGISLSLRRTTAKSIRNICYKFNADSDCPVEFFTNVSRDGDHVFIMAVPKLACGQEMNTPELERNEDGPSDEHND